MKSSDTTDEPTVNAEAVVSEAIEPEDPLDLTTAATQLNNTEDMDGDTKKAQSYIHNRRVNYGKYIQNKKNIY